MDLDIDARWRVTVLRSLGELYEANGQRQKAIDVYSQITQLWMKADPALQPWVQEIRARVDKLLRQSG